MSLVLRGPVVDVAVEERRTGQGEVFEQTSVWVQNGRVTEQCSLGRDWPGPVPAVGDDLVAEVALRAFSRRAGGVGVQMTLLRPASMRGEV